MRLWLRCIEQPSQVNRGLGATASEADPDRHFREGSTDITSTAVAMLNSTAATSTAITSAAVSPAVSLEVWHSGVGYSFGSGCGCGSGFGRFLLQCALLPTVTIIARRDDGGGGDGDGNADDDGSELDDRRRGR